MEQAVGDMSADAVAAFDRPDSVIESLCGGEHFGVAGVVGDVSAGGQHAAGGVDGFDGGCAFVWPSVVGEGTNSLGPQFD
ncbi:hypothetical protein ACWDYH_06480 [Nocardia goodfellowii]